MSTATSCIKFNAHPNRMLEAMFRTLETKGRSLADFKKGDLIRSRTGYTYTLQEDPGTHFQADFQPYLSPGEMLALGVFEGKYLNDSLTEFPAEWFLHAGALGKLHPEGATVEANYFQVASRLPLSTWRTSGWVPNKGGHVAGQYPALSDPSLNKDERGWFQWYCRYWMGRRIPALDSIQIKRWKAFRRHAGAVKANCTPGDLSCRPRQRQALLNWAHNPFI